MTEGNALEGLKNILSNLSTNGNQCIDMVKRRGIAFGSIPRSYSDRIVVVGEAAGQIKTTTGGGIYYGLLGAEIASDIIRKAFKKGNFQAKTLSEYQRLWRKSLGRELVFGEYFHKFYSKLDDNSIDALFEAAEQDNFFSFVSENGKFDWHKNAVTRILRSPNLRRVLWNGLVK